MGVADALIFIESAPWEYLGEMKDPASMIILTGNEPTVAFGDLMHYWYTLKEAARAIHVKGTEEQKARALDAILGEGTDADEDALARVLAWRHYSTNFFDD